MELSRKVCVAAEDASLRCKIPSAIHGIVSKSVCRGGMERSMSLFCVAIHGMRGKSVCRGWFGWILGGCYGKKKDVRKRKRSYKVAGCRRPEGERRRKQEASRKMKEAGSRM